MRDLNKIPSSVYLVFFIVLAILLRFLSFRFSVIDHDESTYLVIAQELLKGKRFYIDVWDTKPVGIFLVFAAILKVFGHSVIAVRAVAAVVIGLTAHLLFLSAKRWGHQSKHAIFAGLVYLVMCATHRWNFPANSEIFFNIFTALGLFFFLGKKNMPNFFLTGLAIGMGFMIKYFVLFDLAALWLFYVLSSGKISLKEKSIPLLRNSLAMGTGFILPFLSVLIYFSLKGIFLEFWLATFIVPGKYSEGFNLLESLNFFANFHLVYAPLILPFYWIILRGKDRALAKLGIIWWVLSGIIITVPGKLSFHYYFQLFIPLSFLSPALFNMKFKSDPPMIRYRKIILATIIMGFLVWNAGMQYKWFIRRPDTRREIAAFLTREMDKNDEVYCYYSTVVYFLLDISPPTKYVHPSLLANHDHIEALGIDTKAELQYIINQKPGFMVLEKDPQPLILSYINDHYELLREFQGGFRILRYRQ